MAPGFWQLLFICLVFLPLAFLPTIIALKRQHPQKVPIILINVFGGLIFGVGWVVALIWSLVGEIAKRDVAAELEKLQVLKDKGALTQEEFDLGKRRILGQ